MDPNQRKLSFKARNPEETKERILLSAIEEFSEFGFLGARVERIAQRSDVTMRMLYHYFKSKKYLYAVVLEHVFQTIEISQDSLTLDTEDPHQRIKALVAFFFHQLVSNPTYVKLFLGQNFLEGGHLERLRQLHPRNERLKMVLRETLEDGQSRGAFRKDLDLDHLWSSLQAVCWGSVPLLDEPDPLTSEEIIGRQRRAEDIILRYLTP